MRSPKKVMAGCGLMLLATSLTTGCASTPPPKELIAARQAYMEAEAGPAATYNPAQLHAAAQALDVAEKAYDDDGDSDRVRDFSYVAARRAQRADAEGSFLASARAKELAEQQYVAAQGQIAQQNASELQSVRGQLRAGQQTNAQQLQAQQQIAEALKQLALIDVVTVGARGTVITLSGNVLFPSGQSKLQPAARERLNAVAEALKLVPDRTIIVEGHTDSRGSSSLNDELSSDRADSVRDYLVSRGVPENHVEVRGKGASEPIAPNSTAEGRASNRRVEIIIPPEGAEPK